MAVNNGTVQGLELSYPGNLKQFRSRFNLVIVAEGYGGRCECYRSQFEADAKRVVHQLSTTAPFMDHLDAFNIFLLHVHSDQEGADRGTAKVDTYFDAAFPGTITGLGLPPQLLLVDEELVYKTVAAQFQELELQSNLKLGPPHKIIVLVNTKYDGGSGGGGDGIAVASRAVDLRTVLHELGHTFGLVDEYPPGGVLGPNLSLKHNHLPWEQLATTAAQPTGAGNAINFDTVGAFTDPEFESFKPDKSDKYYRSQWLCRMRYCCHPAFCTACRAHIKEQLLPFSADQS